VSPAERAAPTALDFRAIAEAIPEMVWTALPGGEIDYVSAVLIGRLG
jgi:hypothetical protein